MFRPLAYPIIPAILLLLFGCASQRPGDIQTLSQDIPESLQKKFQIEDKLVANPSPAGSPSQKKSKKAGKKKRAKEVKAAFVFPSRRPSFNPIWIGEKQTLEITYIGMRAGEFTLEVLPLKQMNARSVYHLKGRAVSSSVMGIFYEVNDTIESFWDFDGLFSHRFHLVLDQTKQKRDVLELFDSETKKEFYWNRRNHVEKGISESKDYFDIPVFPQDSFSALFYVRTLPLEDGKVYTFPVVSEGKSWDAVVTVMRREMMETPLGRKMCVVVRPQTRFQGIMQQEKTPSLIWLTDDDRRFIVRLEAQIKVGYIAAKLSNVQLGEKPNAQ